MTVVLAPTAQEAHRYQFTLATDVVPVSSATELEEALSHHPAENLVVVSPDVDWQLTVELAERFRTLRPDVGFIVQRRRFDVSSLTQALRAGIREVVDADDAAALVAACSRSRALSQSLQQGNMQVSDTSSRGRLIVVFSPKGGTGKTMLATNLAVSFAAKKFRTCLVDLDLQFGDIAIALRLEPTRTTADALGMREAIDEHALNSLLLPYRPNLAVLPGPTRPADAEFISADLVSTLLDGLLAINDIVVVDTPPTFNDCVLRALDMADDHVLVTTPDMASLKSLRVALDTLSALGYSATKRHIILNRDEPNLGLTAGDIRDILHMPVTASIPSNREVVVCLNRGNTIVEASPRNPVSKAIRGIADRFAASASSRIEHEPVVVA
jgi:pilus assembly protein CpaE